MLNFLKVKTILLKLQLLNKVTVIMSSRCSSAIFKSYVDKILNVSDLLEPAVHILAHLQQGLLRRKSIGLVEIAKSTFLGSRKDKFGDLGDFYIFLGWHLNKTQQKHFILILTYCQSFAHIYASTLRWNSFHFVIVVFRNRTLNLSLQSVLLFYN